MSTCILCNAEVDPVSDIVWHKDGFDIVRCPSCGLVFRVEPPTEQSLSTIYNENYFRDHPEQANRHGYADYLRDAALHRANARRRLRLLAPQATTAGRLLDVGCAGGFFVDEARRAGWDASGVDVSDAMVDFATSQLGVLVVCASFAQTDPGPPFDAITMWDYIEHSIDPRRDLEKAHEQLRPGGIIALSTGDIGTLVARVTGNRWHLLTPEHHNFFFDEKALLRLLEETGFDVLQARHRASLYSVSHVLYKLGASGRFEAVRRTASRAGRSALGQIGVPLNLYDIVTVVARRR
jgi:2-polyprenyl-3-methyl-5-hydroxy-6-metoxy-1,4-benzoquinol methylase